MSQSSGDVGVYLAARAGDLIPLLCPECGAQIHGLMVRGNCPACLFPLSTRYIALDGDTWLRTPAGDSALRAIVGNIAFKLIYTLEWNQARTGAN